jgi:signal peptide peptidase SppA
VRNFRIAELVFNQPLMISESKLNVILQVLGPRMNLDVSGLPQSDMVMLSDEQRRRSGYRVDNGVATIGIYGPLMHRLLAGEYPSGGPTTYAEIRASFDTALMDDGVEEIKLEIDSHGGMVSGVFDLAEHIFQSRGLKRITAVVNESAYSAAYLLAAAAEWITVPRTGGVGSIGIICTHADLSRAEDAAGITMTHIYAGARKVDGSPHMPLSTEAQTLFQANVNQTYDLFTQTVARYRGMSVQDVRDTEAGFFVGKKAVAAGLADEVMAATDELATKRTKTQPAKGGNALAANKKEVNMTREELQTNHAALYASIVDEARTQGANTAIQEERARVVSILTIPGPAAAAHKDLLMEGIKEGKSAGDVSLSIQHKEAEMLSKAGKDIQEGAVRPAPAADTGDHISTEAAQTQAVGDVMAKAAESWQKRN